MVKFLQVTFHFEYSEQLEAMFDEHDVKDYVRMSMIEGKDCDGKHFGTQIYPGSSSVIQAQVEEEKLDALLNALREFRDLKRTRHHLQAVVLPIERKL